MIELVTCKDGYVVAVIKQDSHASRWVKEQQRLDYDRSVDVILPMLKSGDTVLDIGALIGGYTVPFAKAVGETGKVLAFEPNLEAYVCLAVNCRDLSQVFLLNSGLGKMNCRIPMILENNVGASHIIGKNDRPDPDGVLILPLDSFNLDHCDFIKLDVEGFEVFVIRGAWETLKKFHPKMFVELNDGALARYGFTKDDIIKPLLEDLGYKLVFPDPKFGLEQPQLDVFFL